MKPIIVFTETKDGQIIMSTEEFQKHINDAYEAGKNDVLKYNFENIKDKSNIKDKDNTFMDSVVAVKPVKQL